MTLRPTNQSYATPVAAISATTTTQRANMCSVLGLQKPSDLHKRKVDTRRGASGAKRGNYYEKDATNHEIPQNRPSNNPPHSTPQPDHKFQITSTLMQTWTVLTTTGDAGVFHARSTDQVDQPEVWVHEVNRPTFALGSTQPESVLKPEQAKVGNFDVCKRRSGGGLVRINPGELWVDILLPSESHLWNIDVGASMVWVGQAWADALKDLIPNIEPVVYSGPLLNRDIGKVVCFGGMGSGEVKIDEYKVVGISQRRTRKIARFQCLLKQKWHPDQLRPYIADALSLDLPWKELRVGFPPEMQPIQVDNTSLLESLISHLPRP